MPSSKRKSLLHLWLLEMAADLAAVTVSYFAVFFIRFHSDWGISLFTYINRGLGVRDTAELQATYSAFYLTSAFRIILLIAVALCVLYALFDLYSSRRPLRKRMIAWNVLLANTVALCAFYAYFYISRNTFHPRSFFVTIMPVNAVVCIVFRQLLYTVLSAARERTGIDVVRAVLVGKGEDADFIHELTSLYRPHGITIVNSMVFDANAPFDQSLAGMGKLVADNSADMLITAERELPVPQIMQILELCSEQRIAAKILSEEFSVIVNQARIRSDLIRGVPLMHFSAPSDSKVESKVYRIVDIIMALLLLIILSPLLLTVAVIIKITSSGNVLFPQERIGVNRRPFTMLKFRTMHDRADELVAQLEEFNESGRGLFKMKQDPRTTGIGRLLRRFSLDELPQLINVLRGDMSIVGPRPLPRRDFEGYYENWHYSRHEGMPGITCLWQVSGRSDLDFHNMCILDVYYLRNRNWILNLKILFRTVQAVLFARGAY